MASSFEAMAARRFGLGLRSGEAPPADVEALMRQVARGTAAKPRFPREGVAGRRETLGRLVAVRTVEARAAQAGRPNPALRTESEREADRLLARDSVLRIVQGVASENGFFERLASFWCSHFAIDCQRSFELKLLTPLFETEAIRPHLAGSFADLLKAAAFHPAMLLAYDQTGSVGPASPAAAQSGGRARSDLARQLLARYTVGSMGAPDGVTEQDIRATSLLLAGLGVDMVTFGTIHDERAMEPSAQTVLGKVYGAEGRSPNDHLTLATDLASRPDTAAHLCGKLAAHFIADEPPAEIIRAMTEAWIQAGGNLTAVYRAMVSHPQAFAPPPGKVVPPFDYVVSVFRATGWTDRQMGDVAAQVSGGGADGAAESTTPATPVSSSASAAASRKLTADVAQALTLDGLRRMGQPVWQQPMPEGFVDRADALLAPQRLEERIAWARLAANALVVDPDPQTLVANLLGGSAPGDPLISVVRDAPSRLQASAMLLLSPQFNRR